MTQPNPDLDERLARLAARKAGAKPAAAPAAGSATNAPAPARTRRKHPAATARILSLGLTSSAFLSIIGAFGQQTPHASVAAAAPARRNARVASAPVRTKVVVKLVHHPLYVDRYGRPVPPPTVSVGGAPSYRAAPVSGVPAAGSPAPALATPPAVSGPAPTTPTVAPTPAPAAAPTPRPTTPPPTVVTTPPPPPPPACSGTKCP